MKTATTGLYKVVTVNGESRPMTKRQAEKIARWLREGRTERRFHTAPIAATVVAV